MPWGDGVADVGFFCKEFLYQFEKTASQLDETVFYPNGGSAVALGLFPGTNFEKGSCHSVGFNFCGRN